MVSRVSISLALAVTLTIGLASVVSADTFPGPAGNQTSALALFTRVVDGVAYDWYLSADRDSVAGYSKVYASYSASIDVTCHGGDFDGEPGNRFISFYGEADKRFVVPTNLAAAVAGGTVSGTEDSYDSCTDTSTSRARTITFKFALHATARATTYNQEQCVDFSENGDSPMRLTLANRSRTAAGTALVNGRRVAIREGGISNQRWSSVDDASCAEEPV